MAEKNILDNLRSTQGEIRNAREQSDAVLLTDPDNKPITNKDGKGYEDHSREDVLKILRENNALKEEEVRELLKSMGGKIKDLFIVKGITEQSTQAIQGMIEGFGIKVYKRGAQFSSSSSEFVYEGIIDGEKITSDQAQEIFTKYFDVLKLKEEIAKDKELSDRVRELQKQFDSEIEQKVQKILE